MNINHIHSGSDGNCIIVSDGDTNIMFDAGMPFRLIPVKMSEIDAVFITHSHQDHCRAAKEMIRRGVRVYMPHGEHLPGSRSCKAGRGVTVGTMYVRPFSVIHDTPNPLGYLFRSVKLVKSGIYMADTSPPNIKFPPLTHIIVECNYEEKRLEANDGLHEAVKDRIRKYHMSLEGLLGWLDIQDLSICEEIHLLHLSKGHCDPEEAMSRVQAYTGVPTYTLNEVEK